MKLLGFTFIIFLLVFLGLPLLLSILLLRKKELKLNYVKWLSGCLLICTLASSYVVFNEIASSNPGNWGVAFMWVLLPFLIMSFGISLTIILLKKLKPGVRLALGILAALNCLPLIFLLLILVISTMRGLLF